MTELLSIFSDCEEIREIDEIGINTVRSDKKP